MCEIVEYDKLGSYLQPDVEDIFQSLFCGMVAAHAVDTAAGWGG